MRPTLGLLAGLVSGIVFAAIVFELNNTIGRWFLHFIPIYWFTTVSRDGTETYTWATAARVVDWIYLLGYLIPTTLYGLAMGFKWGREKVVGKSSAAARI